MAKSLDLKINVDTETGIIAINRLSDSVDKLSENTLQASQNAKKSTSAFQKLGDGIRALAGATIVLKAFDVAVETFKSLDVVSRAVEKALAAVKAAFFTLAPIVENFGKATLALLTGEFEEAGKYAGIFTEQLKKSVDTFIELNDQAQTTVDLFRELRDSERDLNIEVAKRQSLIEKNKFLAEDETRTIAERIEAAKTAFALETDIANERIKLEQRRIELIKSDPTRDPDAEATLNELATARIAIYQAQNDQFSRQTELNNKINQLQKEAPILDDNFRAQIKDGTEGLESEKRDIIMRSNKLTGEQAIDLLQQDIAEEIELQKKKNEEITAIAIASARQAANIAMGISDIVYDDKLRKAEKGSKEEAILLEKQWKFNKKLQLSAAIIDGAKAITSSLAQSPVALGPAPNPAGIASLALAASTTALNIAKIAASKYDSGGASPSAPNVSIPEFNPQQNNVNVSNINQVQAPVQAYISATDVSNALEARKMINDKNKL